MTISKIMKNELTLQNLADFENKSLLIVDDDNPFRERLARACLLYTSDAADE